MEAINLFQHKPQEALVKYGHNAEVMKFFDRMAKNIRYSIFSIKNSKFSCFFY